MGKLFIFLLLFQALFSYYIYQPNHVIEYLNKEELDEYYYKVIKRSFALTFQDAYAYNEIDTNPPQPDFDNNYHEKVDIPKLIYAVNQTNIPIYKFYQEIITRIAKLKDLSIDIKSNYEHFKILSDLYPVCPIDFFIRKMDDKPELFCVFNEKYQNIFDQNLLNEIKSNINSPINTINGKDPFDYISNFGGNIKAGKNPHGTFSNKFNLHNGQNLATFPLDSEDFNMEINYKNGKNINVTYLIMSKSEIPELNNTLIKQYEDKQEEDTKKSDEGIQWDYNNDWAKCRIDSQNQVNVFNIDKINSNVNSYSNDINKLYQCIDLFGQNNYPIIIIFNKNVNLLDIKILPKILIELISPLISARYYTAFKTLRVSSEKIPISYAENNISYYEEPKDLGLGFSELLSSEEKEGIIKRKISLKNKRKPTDILVYTDGTLVSTAAVFMKIFQYYGSGIVTGYFGNPHKNSIPFDSAQSSGIEMRQDCLKLRCPRGYKELAERYETTMNLSQSPYFYADIDFKLPLEFSVTPVDEKVDIYEYLKGSNYQLFVDEAKKIFEKYKTQCNPKNKKLVLVTSECDNKFSNSYTHGGYECGDDGKWTNNCVASFCDQDYIFNYKNKECIPISQKFDFSGMIKKSVINVQTRSVFEFWTIFPIISLGLIFAFIVYYETKKKSKNNNKSSEDNGEELISIQE